MMIVSSRLLYLNLFSDNTVSLRMFPPFRLVGSTLIVGFFNFSDIDILVQMSLFCASKAVQQHQCLLPNRCQSDLRSCDSQKCCQTSPYVHWTFSWEMKLPLIESHFLSGFIAMNNLEKKKIASYLALFTICFFVFSAASIIHSTVFTRHLRYATYNAGAGTVVTGGDELLVCQTHVFTYMNISCAYTYYLLTV